MQTTLKTGGLAPMYRGKSGLDFYALRHKTMVRSPERSAHDWRTNQSYNSDMSHIPENFNFTWVGDYYGRPIFHTEGGDLGILCRMNRSGSLGVSNTTYDYVDVIQVEDDYHLSVGSTDQRAAAQRGS